MVGTQQAAPWLPEPPGLELSQLGQPVTGCSDCSAPPQLQRSCSVLSCTYLFIFPWPQCKGGCVLQTLDTCGCSGHQQRAPSFSAVKMSDAAAMQHGFRLTLGLADRMGGREHKAGPARGNPHARAEGPARSPGPHKPWDSIAQHMDIVSGQGSQGKAQGSLKQQIGPTGLCSVSPSRRGFPRYLPADLRRGIHNRDYLVSRPILTCPAGYVKGRRS